LAKKKKKCCNKIKNKGYCCKSCPLVDLGKMAKKKKSKKNKKKNKKLKKKGKK
jgi:endogenous inhibitor of DNA gyrase (YacG/DUF329 family)